jgi:hypothetical protein
MMVLLDTFVWSLALRRKQADLSRGEQDLKTALQELVQDGRAQIVGRQELLSGIRAEETFCKGTLCGPSTNLNSGSRTMKKRRA